AELRAAGVEPYPVKFSPTTTVAALRDAYPDLEPGSETGERVTVAGRVVAKREMGRRSFLVLREEGAEVQLFCPVKALDDASRELFGYLDVGDWVGATGEVLATKTG